MVILTNKKIYFDTQMSPTPVTIEIKDEPPDELLVN